MNTPSQKQDEQINELCWQIKEGTSGIDEVKQFLSQHLTTIAQGVTRFEVIDKDGRAYVKHRVSVELSFQDEDRTLKVFLSNKSLSSTPEPTKEECVTCGKYHPKESPHIGIPVPKRECTHREYIKSLGMQGSADGITRCDCTFDKADLIEEYDGAQIMTSTIPGAHPQAVFPHSDEIFEMADKLNEVIKVVNKLSRGEQ